MFSDYKAQIDQILKNTEKEEANNTSDKIAAVASYKIMIGAISKFVEKESCSNPEFDAALSLEWKSAGRMLKHIWSNAEKMALRHGQIASCCLTKEAVYAWAREYYLLDDREAVMKEKAEKAEAEQKQKEEKEKEAQYEKRALDILSKQSGWDNLSDGEKKKKIASKIKSLKTSDSRKSNNQLQRPLQLIAGPQKAVLFLWQLMKKKMQHQTNPRFRITALRYVLQKIQLNWRWNLPIPLTDK